MIVCNASPENILNRKSARLSFEPKKKRVRLTLVIFVADVFLVYTFVLSLPKAFRGKHDDHRVNHTHYSHSVHTV